MRTIASILIYNQLAYTSNLYSHYTYVGDPLNIVYQLSSFAVDEVLLVLIGRHLDRNLTRVVSSIRSIADFPISVAGCIHSASDGQTLMALGVDRLYLNPARIHSNSKLLSLSSDYGVQSIGLLVDYCFSSGKRYLYSPHLSFTSPCPLHSYLSSIDPNSVSDIILSNVTRNGTLMGFDHQVFTCLPSSLIRNPILLAGGGTFSDIQSLSSSHDFHTSGLCFSSNMFLYGPKDSALVCMDRFSS